jgi:thymidylate synthase (FAD)
MTEQIPTHSPTEIMVHKPHGTVDLVEYSADDLMVVNAARVSYANRSDWENSEQLNWDTSDYDAPDHVQPKLSDADEGLIGFLMRGHHGTPFEQNFFQFHIRAPIFVFREWHRHRIGISINEESARYVPYWPHFYLPNDDHVRVQVGKPGHYTYEPVGDPDFCREVRGELYESYELAYLKYTKLMEAGVAKEIARACLPVGIYSQMLWSCNARSLMSFLSLRNHPKALQEIRDYAAVLEGIFAEKMPITAAAFITNGRVAP